MIHNIQVLRALAAYMVFLLHFSIYLRPVAPGAASIGIGAAGVDIFFVISGFIMVATTMGRRTTPLAFLLKRIARLVPVYWFVTLVIVLLVMVGFRPIGVLEIRPSYVVQSLLFIPFMRGEFVEPLNSVGWTLNYEMFFYVVFAALLVVRSDGWRIAGLVAVLVGLGLSSLADPAGLLARYYTRPIVIEFALGAVLGYAYMLTLDRPAAAWRLPGYGLIAAGVLLLVASEVVAQHLAVQIELLAFPRPLVWGTSGLLIVAGALAAERSGAVWRSRVLIQQGNASYSIYLVHNLVLHTAFKIAGAIGLGGIAGVAVIFVLAFGTTCVLGMLLYRWVELPMNQGLRSAFRSIGARIGAPSIAVAPSHPGVS